jgi:hypothetical protein
MPPKQSIGSEIYSGAAGFGKIYAWFGAVFGTIIAISLIIFGIYSVNHKNHLKSIEGKVTKKSHLCNTQTQNKNTTTTCKFDVEYKVGVVSYTVTFSSPTIFDIGDKVTVWYDPNHPDKGEFNPMSKNWGWLMIGIAIVMIVGVWIRLWITYKYKFAAAAGGASAFINLVR